MPILFTYVGSWLTAEAFEFGDLLDGAFHTLGQLRLEDDVALAVALERGRGDSVTVLVGGAARVLARVLRVHRRNLQNDKAEVAEGADARARLQRLAVKEPFDLFEFVFTTLIS